MSEKPLPFHLQFVAGAIAGISEIVTMYPLDAPKRATKFAANEQYGILYKRLFKQEKMTQSLSILTGVSAGITEACIIVPFELVKIRMQDKASAAKYKSTQHAILTILKEEGAFAFYKGLEATVWRHALWNGGYFGVIHYVRRNLPQSDNPNMILMNNFIAGTIGGTVGTILNTPVDVVKTRIQNQTAANYKYGWALPAVGIVAREEGIAALYKGFIPKVLRLGPGGGILLVVFDQVSKWMRANMI